MFAPATACASPVPPLAVTLLHPPGYSYYAMLREKLHWSEVPKR